MLRQQVAVTAGAQPLGVGTLETTTQILFCGRKEDCCFFDCFRAAARSPGHAQSGLSFASAAAYASKVGTEGSNG